MNPDSVEQKYARCLVEHALETCRVEHENTEFLIHVKEILIKINQTGWRAPSDAMSDAPLS